MVENSPFIELVEQREALYGEFEMYIGCIFRTHRGSEKRRVSPERLALHDWYALYEVRSEHDMLQATLEADKAFGDPEDLALPDELEDSKARLQRLDTEMDARTQRYRMNLITDQRQAGSPKESPYNKTLLHLNEILYPKLFHFEQNRLNAMDRSGYFTPDEIVAMAMKRVVEQVKIRIFKVQQNPLRKTA